MQVDADTTFEEYRMYLGSLDDSRLIMEALSFLVAQAHHPVYVKKGELGEELKRRAEFGNP